MKKNTVMYILIISAIIVTFLSGCSKNEKPQKPTPDQAIEMLKKGNERFTSGKSTRPHLDAERIAQAGRENQGDHAYATVITCSDSRVPVEHLFDAGIMDIFVIRVAGNVCDTDEAGSIEYGMAHVNTPVLVVLGHTQCGAVTAVTHAVNGKGHALERNIPPLVDNIEPAVKRAMALYPHTKGDDIIPLAIKENVWVGIRDLFMKSPAVRELVKTNKAKVVGAIYDVGNGRVNWLEEANVVNILHEVEANPDKAVEPMAATHKEEPAAHEEKAPTVEKEEPKAEKETPETKTQEHAPSAEITHG